MKIWTDDMDRAIHERLSPLDSGNTIALMYRCDLDPGEDSIQHFEGLLREAGWSLEWRKEETTE